MIQPSSIAVNLWPQLLIVFALLDDKRTVKTFLVTKRWSHRNITCLGEASEFACLLVLMMIQVINVQLYCELEFSDEFMYDDHNDHILMLHIKITSCN